MESLFRQWLGKPSGAVTPQDLDRVKVFAIVADGFELDGLPSAYSYKVYGKNEGYVFTPGSATRDAVPDNALQIKNLGDLRHCKNLETILLVGCDIQSLAGVEVLSGLGNLRDIRLMGLANLESLSGLERLAQVEYLTIFSVKVQDFTPVAAMKGLQNLALEDLEISNIDFVCGLENLQVLWMDMLPEVSLEPAAKLPALEKFHYQKRGSYESVNLSKLKEMFP